MMRTTKFLILFAMLALFCWHVATCVQEDPEFIWESQSPMDHHPHTSPDSAMSQNAAHHSAQLHTAAMPL
jgi:zona occludens toxin (predicted ATPase)